MDGSRRIIKAADSLGDLSKTGRTAWDHLADSLREMAKTVKKADMPDNAMYVDNAVDAASDTGKRLDDVVGGGGNAANKIGNSDIIAHSYTRDEIINSLDGVTQKSTGIANNIQSGKIKVTVLGNELFESIMSS